MFVFKLSYFSIQLCFRWTVSLACPRNYWNLRKSQKKTYVLCKKEIRIGVSFAKNTAEILTKP